MTATDVPPMEGAAPNLVTRVKEGDLFGAQKLMLMIGALALIVPLILGLASGSAAFYFSYLTAYMFGLSLCLGAIFFVLIQHITRAGWSITVRRVAENVAASVWIFVPLFLPIIFGFDHLFGHWAGDAAATDPIIQGKSAYLNTPFFFVRWAIYFAAWIGMATYFRKKSIEQDESGDPAISLRLARVAAPAIIVWALTLTFAAVDGIMSLNPHWFSTIFGVCYFAGSFMAFLALGILLCRWLGKRGYLKVAVNTEHYHDLGKLMFAFMVFWTYVNFSQFMLIDYANLPEETQFFAMRQGNGWETAFAMLAIGHFVAPFVLVMSRHIKRHGTALVIAASWMLIVHWIDIQYQVMPNLANAHGGDHAAHSWFAHFTGYDLPLTVGMLLLLVGVSVKNIRSSNLVPVRDPRLAESLHFENY